MIDLLYLAWRYLAFHRVKSTVLVIAVATIVYLPVGLNIIVGRSAEQLTTRAQTTPLLIGSKGSQLELVLNSLYFESDTPPVMQYDQVRRVEASGMAQAIPLHTRFKTTKSPIVGTTLDYFEFRNLDVAQGESLGMIGQCVLGAKAAKVEGVGPGDYVYSSPESVFDFAGVYSLKMKVVGVLEPTGTPDDLAVFVDLKTAWVIAGKAHGHRDLGQPDAAGDRLPSKDGQVVGNAAVFKYAEITPKNLASFHFHGDLGALPINSIIVVPKDEKSSTLLQGRYLGDKESVQIVQPATVMDQLLSTIFTVRGYVMLAVIIVGVATLATVVLVFLLSLQLRHREMAAMQKIGGSRVRIGGLVVVEILGVLGLGVVFAGLLSLVTSWFTTALTRAFVMLSN